MIGWQLVLNGSRLSAAETDFNLMKSAVFLSPRRCRFGLIRLQSRCSASLPPPSPLFFLFFFVLQLVKQDHLRLQAIPKSHLRPLRSPELRRKAANLKKKRKKEKRNAIQPLSKRAPAHTLLHSVDDRHDCQGYF